MFWQRKTRRFYGVEIITLDLWEEIGNYVNYYYDSYTITIQKYDGTADELNETNKAFGLIGKYKDEIESIKIRADKGKNYLDMHFCGNRKKTLYTLKISGETDKEMKPRFMNFIREIQYQNEANRQTKAIYSFLLNYGIIMSSFSIKECFFFGKNCYPVSYTLGCNVCLGII